MTANSLNMAAPLACAIRVYWRLLWHARSSFVRMAIRIWLILLRPIRLELSAIILGNKRTGFVVGILCLELHGYRFTASEAEATRAVLALAASEMTEERFTVWLQNNSEA